MRSTLGRVAVGCLACCVVVACGAGQGTDGGWVALFNGEDLSGWTQKGGKAKYEVQDGCIVGSSVPNTSNSFLCTEKPYADFSLEFEFKCDPALNSGVQVRSQSLPEYKNGRVHGYQVEIDVSATRKRWWTAGIYDEGRRGWLFPGKGGGDGKAFTEQGGKVTKSSEWNHVRIEAVGPRIRTWLNGELRADLKDDMTPSGFIGLQVHGVGKREAPLQIRWRNVRIRVLDGPAATANE